MIRIQILNDHNDPTCEKQQWTKCQITNSLSDQTSWNTNCTAPFQLQNSLSKIMYVITRDRNIANNTFVLLFSVFDAVSSRLLLGPWHSNDPEPKILSWRSWAGDALVSAWVQATFSCCHLSMMINHFFDTPYSTPWYECEESHSRLSAPVVRIFWNGWREALQLT